MNKQFIGHFARRAGYKGVMLFFTTAHGDFWEACDTMEDVNRVIAAYEAQAGKFANSTFSGFDGDVGALQKLEDALSGEGVVEKVC